MKRLLTRLAVAALALIGLAYATERYSDSNTHQLFGKIINRVETDEKVVALTFDDGPSDTGAAEVLKILSDRNVTATFFVNGKMVERFPEAMRAIIAAGHEVGNHTWTHRHMMFVPPEVVRQEIEQTDAILRDNGYDRPLHFRPPFGRKLVTLPRFLARQDRLTVMWSVAAETFQPDQTAEEIASAMLQQTGPGDILLLHVMFRSNANSRAALPVIIDTLKDQGFRFLTVSELLKHH